MSDTLWTADDVAMYLGLKTRTVWGQARSGKLPSIRVGRRVRFDPTAIKQHVAAK